jgi:homogentisate 1,2-dioxygenase
MTEGPIGFGGFHESEALEGAVPRGQNSPRRVKYGLYAEQLNGVSFTVPRAHNKRVWMYRIRPSTLIERWRPYAHPTFDLSFTKEPSALDLYGWKPQPIDGAASLDFLDGVVTYGGAGHPAMRRGFAVHIYTATEAMGRKAFVNHDGEMLVLPDTGRIRLTTELGVLEASPGELLIVPRALVFKIDPADDGPIRGYVGEAYARHFELPERGVAGANGLTDARFFRAPHAAFEEDGEPWRLVAKQGGVLRETTRTGSPFDVVGWHGNLAPYVYDLETFSPLGGTLVDHQDPSIFTVLSAPLDQPGENTLDFVTFPERWDPTEHTFRPPYFHRNAATELNGIVTGESRPDDVYSRGGMFLTPTHAPHGVPERTLRAALEGDDSPVKLGLGGRWMQFESTFCMQVSAHAEGAANRDEAFGDVVRDLPVFFDREG